jgi:hypothetical protein
VPVLRGLKAPAPSEPFGEDAKWFGASRGGAGGGGSHPFRKEREKDGNPACRRYLAIRVSHF